MSCFRRFTSFIKRHWSIVVISAGFLHFMLFTGILYNYNLLHIQLKDSFNSTATQAGIPGAVSIGVFRCSAVFATYIFQTLGHRTTVALGVTLCSLALLISSFMQDIGMIYFTYGVLFGLGNSANHLTIIDMVFRNCDKRNATRATCFAFCGVSVGFLISPWFDWLYITYTWRVALRILSVALAVVGYSSALLMVEMNTKERNNDDGKAQDDAQQTQKMVHASKEDETDENENPMQTNAMHKDETKIEAETIQNISVIQKYIIIFRRADFVISLMGFILASTAISFTFISVGSYLQDTGMDMPSIATTIVWMGVSDLAARISAALFSDRVPISRTTQFAVNCIIAAIPSVCVPFIVSCNGHTAAMIVLSVPRSFMVILLPTIGMELSSNETRAEAVAVIYLVFGIGALLTPCVTDTMYDLVGSYDLAWFNCAGLYMVSAVFISLAAWSNRRRRLSSIRSYNNNINNNGKEEL